MRRYIAAILLVGFAFALRMALDPLLGERAPFLLFTLAVLIAGGRYGVGAGLLATGLSVVLGSWAFLTPRYNIGVLSADQWTNIGAFVATSLAMLVFAHQLVRSRATEAASMDARRSSEAREQRLIDAAEDYAIYELDREGRILTWNKGAERMKGWRPDEIIGQDYRVLHTPEQRAGDRPGKELRIAAETGRYEEEAPRMRKDGSVFAAHVTLFPLREENGEVTGFVKVTRDISQRNASAAALLESRRRLEGIVESAMDAIITINEEQKIVLFNPAAERMFGCSAEEALGSSVSRFIPERFRTGHDDHIRHFRETGVTTRHMGALGAVSGLRSSGEEFPIEASISNVTIGGERLSTAILRDISERKTGEEARSLLAREVDHRAKNALAVAQALVSLTRADTAEELAETIKGRISALARAHSLLSQSRWQGAPLAQLIHDELSAYAKEERFVLEGPPLTTSADAVQSLSLMFHELATNALKYGALSKPEGSVRVAWSFSGANLDISWEESGGPEVKAPTASGFGSKLLRQVAVRQLNSQIDFDWRREGLRVEISVPRELFMLEQPGRANEAAGSGDVSEGGIGNKKPRVLLVEDEELVALELSSELTRLGWAVVGPAATLKEARALLSKEVDAAVLDVNLRGRPVYPFAETLVNRHVPFIFCTGYEMVDPEGRFPDAPVIRKPASAKAVSAALADLLKERAQ